MRSRILAAAACISLLAPAAAFAAAPSSTLAVAAFGTSDQRGGDWRDRDDDRDCGRGKSWGCRGRGNDRYDDRYDRNDRFDRYDRERHARQRYERARYERERYERARYERARYRARYGYRDRRYERYDGYAVACLRAGGRVLGGAVLVVCVP